MKRIGIIGAPCVGKTTLANDLALELRNLGYTVEVVKEYAREYIQKLGEPKNTQTQTLILQKQLENEKGNKGDFLISDSPVILNLIYSLELGSLADSQDCFCYNNILETLFQLKLNQFYDYLFYIPREIPFEKDGVRDNVNMKRVDNRIRGFLSLFNIRYHTISDKSASKKLNKKESREHRLRETLGGLNCSKSTKEEIFEISSFEDLEQEMIIHHPLSTDFSREMEMPKSQPVSVLSSNNQNKPALLDTSKKHRLKDLILAGKNTSFSLGEIQFIVKNFSNKPGRVQYRHVFRDCLSLAKRNFSLEELNKEDIQRYPLCPHCKRRLNTN